MERSSQKPKQPPPQPHFVFVTYPGQGHINPVIHLASRLAQSTAARATFAISVSAYRRMFPSAPADGFAVDDLFSYAPISDGYDNGIKDRSQFNHFISEHKRVGSQNLSDLLLALAARGRPATCIIYTLFLPWAADVARRHGIPSALFWIQPATVFATYYHFFHGYEAVVTAHAHEPDYAVSFPHMPPIRIRNLPSFLYTPPTEVLSSVFTTLRELFAELDAAPAKVLVNSFEGLEPGAVASVSVYMEAVTVGPAVPAWSFEAEVVGEKAAVYMRWLDERPARSVLYVAFGSYMKTNRQQFEEIRRGLREGGRPFLWVVRKDDRGELESELEERMGEGMVVEWCEQVQVLAHPAVGCFVTHCGWNSTLESTVCGVPTVGVPKWSDQTAIAGMAEELWGTGVRTEVNEEGVVTAAELRRCVEVVMDDGAKGTEIRRKAGEWKERARATVREGGPSDSNLKAFVEAIHRLAACGSNKSAICKIALEKNFIGRYTA